MSKREGVKKSWTLEELTEACRRLGKLAKNRGRTARASGGPGSRRTPSSDTPSV